MLLWHAGRLPWAALAIPARDVLLIGATPLVVGRGYRFEVNLLGKAATWLLYLSLGLVMVVHHGSWPLWIFWAGFALALVSLAPLCPQGAAGDRRPERETRLEFSS